MPSEQQTQRLKASGVVAEAGDFINGFCQEQIDGVKELERGKALIDAASKALGGYIDFLRTKEKQEAAERAFEVLRSGGHSKDEIEALRKAYKDLSGKAESTEKEAEAGKKDKGGVQPKYRNPENHAEIWSGRGSAPAWIKPYQVSKDGESPRVYQGLRTRLAY